MDGDDENVDDDNDDDIDIDGEDGGRTSCRDTPQEAEADDAVENVDALVTLRSGPASEVTCTILSEKLVLPRKRPSITKLSTHNSALQHLAKFEADMQPNRWSYARSAG